MVLRLWLGQACGVDRLSEILGCEGGTSRKFWVMREGKWPSRRESGRKQIVIFLTGKKL